MPSAGRGCAYGRVGWEGRMPKSTTRKVRGRDRQPADLMALLVLSEMLADDLPPPEDSPPPDQSDVLPKPAPPIPKP